MDSLPRWVTGTQADRLGLLPAAQEHILACVRSSVRELSQAFALAVPHEDALRIRDDLAFFQDSLRIVSRCTQQRAPVGVTSR